MPNISDRYKINVYPKTRPERRGRILQLYQFAKVGSYLLKITSQGRTQIYNVNGDLSILEEENDADGEVTKEILEGTLQLYQGDDTFGGDEYEVNGTLIWNNDKNADLALEGIF